MTEEMAICLEGPYVGFGGSPVPRVRDPLFRLPRRTIPGPSSRTLSEV